MSDSTMPRRAPAILFLNGASGCGKTTVVRALRAADPDGVYLHFDTIGVPDLATTVREHGSGERWQATTVRRWVARIVTEHAGRALVVLEGQARPSFIESAVVEFCVTKSAIVLMHCDDDQREARLRERGQPELANEQMRSWAAFLKRETHARGLGVIDTTSLTIGQAADAIRDAARALAGGG
jgi:broad-specificity NMP kinase